MTDAKLCGDEASLSTVSRILFDHRLLDVMRELKELTQRVTLLQTLLGKKEEMYFRLVWYARSKPGECEKGKRDVEARYPKEVENLNDEASNWHRGFNSGCLAMSRLVTQILDARRIVQELNEDGDGGQIKEHDYVQQVISEFPMLDS